MEKSKKKTLTNDVILRGKVVSILPEKTGEKNGRTWYLRQVMIETQVGKYNNQVLIAAWNDTGDIIDSLKVGDEVEVKANVSTVIKKGEPSTSIAARSIILKKLEVE